jgi:hypothetical protein
VAITVIVIVEWHWRLGVLNGLTTLIVVLDPLHVQTSVVHERDITAAFLPPKGLPLIQGLIIVMTLLVTIVVVILWRFGHSKVVAIDVDTICHLASE